MNKDSIKKIITMSYLGSAILAYLVVNVLFKSLAGAFGFVQRMYSIDLLNHGLPILAAMGVFLTFILNKKVYSFTEEVVIEVSKVVWPSRRDTVSMTIVVCVFVGIASLLLVVIDFVARNLVQMIIQ